jgi:hypothetical protein
VLLGSLVAKLRNTGATTQFVRICHRHPHTEMSKINIEPRDTPANSLLHASSLALAILMYLGSSSHLESGPLALSSACSSCLLTLGFLAEAISHASLPDCHAFRKVFTEDDLAGR